MKLKYIKRMALCLALTLALALERREVVRAVNSQEGRIQLLLEKEAKETK